MPDCICKRRELPRRLDSSGQPHGRRWWCRAWILQETLLDGQADFVCCYGLLGLAALFCAFEIIVWFGIHGAQLYTRKRRMIADDVGTPGTFISWESGTRFLI